MSQMPSFEPQGLRAIIRPKARTKLAFLLFFALCFAISLFAYSYLSFNPQQLIEQKLAAMFDRYGIDFSCQDFEFSGNEINLKGVVFSSLRNQNFGPVFIRNLKAEITIEPSTLDWFINRVSLTNVRANFHEDDLKALINQSRNIIPSPANQPTQQDHKIHLIEIEDMELGVQSHSAPWPLIRLQSPSITLDIVQKSINAQIAKIVPEGKAAAQLVDPWLENIEISARFQNQIWSYFAHNDVLKKQSYWSADGQIDQKATNTTLVKFSGLPGFLPAKYSQLIAGAKNQLGAFKVRFPLFHNAAQWPVDFQLGLANVRLTHAKIGPTPIGPVTVSIKGHSNIDAKQKSVEVTEGRVAIKSSLVNQGENQQKPLALKLNFGVKASPLMVSAHLSLPATNCDIIAKAIPQGLMPILDSFQIHGEASFDLNLKLDPQMPQNFDHDWGGTYLCKLQAIDNKYSIDRILHDPLGLLRESSQHSIPTQYVPFEQISPYLLKAMIVFEDGGFYHHDGIQINSMIKALKRNIEEGRIAAGGSTITMQTVKNLFFTPERTLSRKLQEIFLTGHLEAELSKSKILEIYANIIEFGDNVYGISQAAEVFFGKPPSDLNVRESAYLATVLPSPIVRFKNFCRGYLSPSYREFLDKRLRLMYTLGRLTDKELHEGLIEPLEFRSAADYPYCQGLASASSRKPL